jgi:hypothetical protein
MPEEIFRQHFIQATNFAIIKLFVLSQHG